tara:strand:- start:959 stop:1438 length:480 start_codon:yes stop_codon:yes gene_type:complete
MATFNNTDFLKYDDYMTPRYAWENIKDYIPKDRVIWEAFYGDGKSGEYLRDLGFDVIQEKEDFFNNNKGDIIVSNPPFSDCKKIMPRLKELDKPFILILPSSKINTQYFKIFKNDIQIIIPQKRIQFIKDGDKLENKCNFDCFYYCYKIGLERDIIWLD